MKKRGTINFVFTTLSIFAGTVLLYIILGIIPSEGFNPSDDGVILAQSYRLLQGQVPHLDFISIRPVGSAALHCIHFLSPLPLEISARWLTLLQYLTYSLLWAWIMVRFSRIRKYRGLIFFAFLGIWGFALNQNHYNLFPWTTIDALFWMILALSFYLPDPKTMYHKNAWLKIGFTVFFVSMAAMSRQTFVLPAIILLTGLIYHGIKLRKWKTLIAGIIMGSIPGLFYFIVLVINDSLPLFIQQLSGRTELFETGVNRFYTEFWRSPLVSLFILTIFLLLVYSISEGSKAGSFYRISLVPIGRIVFGVLFISLGFSVFVSPGNLFAQSFVQFWLLLLLWIFEEVCGQIKKPQRRWFFWALLVSWTSAISLGDNAPVFALGLINTTGLGYILFQFAERGFSHRRLNQFQGVLTVILIGIIILSVHVQRRVNYRDVAASEQGEKLGDVFDGFGRISTNELTFSYMDEIDNIYKLLGFPEGRFVVLPNSAIIYPLFGSPNPLPADWMQGPEFVGSEDYLMEKIKIAITGKEIFFLIDKFDSKRISDTLVPAQFPSESYPYMKELKGLTRVYDLDSKWFEVRVSK